MNTTAERFTRPRKPRGAVLEPVILHAEVVQIPRHVVTVKPEPSRRGTWIALFLLFALAAWPLGALLRNVVR